MKAILFIFSLLAVMLPAAHAMAQEAPPEIHGHRGARGHLPENSIPAFQQALKMGAGWLELDLVVSADSQLVVSHEPWMHEDLCTRPDGQPVRHGKAHNLFRMSLAEIQQYDCGSRGHPFFPAQTPQPVHKPSLREAVMATDSFALANGLPLPKWNLEIKSEPRRPGEWTPPPGRYAELIRAELDSLQLAERSFVQSFDHRILNALHQRAPGYRLGYLTDDPMSYRRDLRNKLDFTPYAYNIKHSFASEGLVRWAHARGIKVIPWTVNEPARMQELLRRGVDGLITDYPDRAALARKAFLAADE